MAQRKLILGFIGRFALVYGLLIVPWPGFKGAYARYFQSLGAVVLAHDTGPRRVHFEAVPENLHHVLDTRIALANGNQFDRQGAGPVHYLELDSRGIGWVPTALLLALILSTPISWPRRCRSLLLGLFAVHAFILFSLAVAIWNNAAALGLLTLTPLWQQMADSLEETLITQIGASFVVPVLIWFVITLRGQDVIRWMEEKK